MTRFDALTAEEQLGLWADRVNDPRGVVPLGWSEVDSLLRRGGLAPSTLCLLGGRTGTRKTTVTVNLVANLLRSGRAVGLVGLDEAPTNYIAKLTSAITGLPDEWLEENWQSPKAEEARSAYLEVARQFTLSRGYRPDAERLSQWLEMAQVGDRRRPEVVFIDYSTLMKREWGGELERMARLMEMLQVWTNEEEVVTIALHQVGRQDDWSSRRYDGDTPLHLGALKYAGEEVADIVFGTYRPAKNRLGNMPLEQARVTLGEKFDEEEWEAAVAMVRRYQDSTFLQLLKNRPGTRLNEEGIELKSTGASMKLAPASETIGEDMRVRGEVA